MCKMILPKSLHSFKAAILLYPPPPLGFPNLLLKGNNLLALHSLKSVSSIYGNVKLIYIDPPYNTGNDSFNYNDNFNHSSWLTFMKNRLEIAREFLRDDGVMFIQCDDNEQAYLKVLCDEIFGRENFVATICWEKKYSPANDSKWLSDNHDFILIYARKKENWRPNLLSRTKEMNARYTNPDNDPRGDWKAGGFSVKTYTPNYDYSIVTPSGKIVYPPSGSCWQTSKENYEKMLRDDRIYFGKNGDSKPQIKQFLSEVQQGVVTKTFWKYDEVGHNQIGKQEIKALFGEPKSQTEAVEMRNRSFQEVGEGVTSGGNDRAHDAESTIYRSNATALFATPKPEALLKRIIEISTQPGDLVMDFFAGSGTTLAVAHKMGRKWVGIEQMDYIENITKERLCKVVLGEQGGVSKAVAWNPTENTLLEKECLPNSFMYAELMPLNETYKKLIIEADENNIADVITKMQKNAFLDYRVDFAKIVKDGDFEALSLEDKKRVLLSCLDSNLSYVPFSEIDDSEFEIQESLIEANKIFYGGGK